MSDAHLIRADGGSITVSASAVDQLVRTAAELVDGARVRRRGVDVRFDEGRAHIDLALTAQLGTVLPELARGVQRSVADAFGAMCGVEPAAVDVAIEEVEE